MRFTIVTPSYGQLDWLRLCVASVRDQASQTRDECRESSVEGGEEDGGFRRQDGERNAGESISVEHIIQDAGTPGIEEFAREVGAVFYRRGGGGVEGRGSRVEGGDGRSETGERRSEGGHRRAQSGGYSLTIYSEKDAGMYDAINKGLRKATGDICAYLNCDEQYLPDTLRWVADYFSLSTNIDVLFGAAIVVRPDGSYVCDRRVMVPTRLHTMVSGNLSVFTSSTFFRRSAVVGRGLFFDPAWRVAGDAEWALRLGDARLGMAAVHRPLSAFAETGSNLSAAANPHAAEESRQLAMRAPRSARKAKPLILVWYRFRRWCLGAYNISPHRYSIYTLDSVAKRRVFDVWNPRFRWRMGEVEE